MNIKYLFIISFLLLGMISCTDKDDPIVDNEGLLAKPTASFSYLVADPKDPFTIKFTNSSKNYVDARWSFDDDSTSSEASPIHTFLKTGTFNVKMIALNEEGYWAQREETVEILPEDLVKLVANPSNGNLQMGYETPMTVQRMQWLEKVNETTYNMLSEKETMDISIPEGEFKTVFVTLTTPKGSEVTLEMLLANLGIVEDLTVLNNEFSISRENGSGRDAGEGSLKLIDNDINTKVYVGDVKEEYFYWQFDYFQPQVVNGYSMTSGNDDDGRDPKSWEILGSQDGEQWVVLDTRTDENFTERKQTRIFSYNNTTAYAYYRIHIISRKSSGSFQMSEFRMLKLPR
ncbi:hypothetical protein HP439_01690 [Sphingobacterium shayense]|uniref:PKD domain-containing protein n=1 Tax=Sphingobacterium shayense TaxID=626343 RepID=UPI0015569773|nr:discoidin domain-containing protein [Sphingobacterium shayense]NQD69436.1 hypothetical protein [Sphingobacterium shayense]